MQYEYHAPAYRRMPLALAYRRMPLEFFFVSLNAASSNMLVLLRRFGYR